MKIRISEDLLKRWLADCGEKHYVEIGGIKEVELTFISNSKVGFSVDAGKSSLTINDMLGMKNLDEATINIKAVK